jgi:hypothetical protein
VEAPFAIRDGHIWASHAPGHGLVLSEDARRDWHRPEIVDKGELGEAPRQVYLG